MTPPPSGICFEQQLLWRGEFPSATCDTFTVTFFIPFLSAAPPHHLGQSSQGEGMGLGLVLQEGNFFCHFKSPGKNWVSDCGTTKGGRFEERRAEQFSTLPLCRAEGCPWQLLPFSSCQLITDCQPPYPGPRGTQGAAP